MQLLSDAKSGWIIATFSLLALFLTSVSRTSSSEKEKLPASVSADPLLGEITLFAGTFAPRGWAFCNGQVLPIASNQALFSLLGTTYGGDGRTTFALPDLRGRVPVHAGQGPGLAPYRLGQKGGTELVPFSQGAPVKSDNAGNIRVVTANTSSSNLQPYATVNYIIAVQGVFPSRN